MEGIGLGTIVQLSSIIEYIGIDCKTVAHLEEYENISIRPTHPVAPTERKGLVLSVKYSLMRYIHLVKPRFVVRLLWHIARLAGIRI